MTKAEIIERINAIANLANSNDNGYHYEVKINEWVKYGKDRTYFSIVETRDNSKHYVKKDYGYYDNNADEFVAGKASIDYTFSGAKFEEPVEVETIETETAETENTETEPTVMTEKYYAFYEEHNGERFYFENGAQCVVVVKAKSADEAWDRFLKIVDSDYENEAKNQIIEEFDEPLDFHFCYYVEWNENFPHFESEPKKRPW